eukprot:scaffold8114_cov126-Cylindrotheca_fusiformis.AAC.10
MMTPLGTVYSLRATMNVVGCCILLWDIQRLESFSMPPIVTAAPRAPVEKWTRLFSIFDDINEQEKTKEEKKDGVDFDNFNPLSYKVSKTKSAHSYAGTQISLRKTKMQELTNELMNAVGEEARIQEVLMNYKSFLLEPLEDPDAVMDADSIYTPQMSRTERFQAYRSSMDERLQNSRNVQVRSILQSMRDFVLSYETSN